VFFREKSKKPTNEKMDNAHEQELARILNNRKKGGRLLGAPPNAELQQQQQQQPLQAPSQTPINNMRNNNNDAGIQPHSPNQPTSATNRVNDSLTSGGIVIQEEQQQNKFAPSTNRYQTTTDVTSKTTVTRPATTNQQKETSQEIAELERIRRQGEDQARQINQLQSTLEQLIQLQRSQGNNNNNNNNNNNSNSGYNFGGGGQTNNKMMMMTNERNLPYQSSSSSAPPPPPPPNMQQRSSPQKNRNNAENNFEQATSMGIFVKPHRSVGSDGRGYITFNTPSRNQRGLHPGSTSPNRGGGGGSRVMGGPQGNTNNNTKSRSIGGGGMVMANNNNTRNSKSPARSVGGLVSSPNNNQQTAVRLPRPGATERIPKPYSSSTLDIDSAVVLLTTGDWFYKLRVHVQSASIVGPAGWQIEASERRYVYLDTTTFILKWGDKPGGDATAFSHYVPIDHITSVNIFTQSEASTQGPEPRIIYYIVMQVVEGGFHARGRAVIKRLCVIATELRDKADMWFDALNTIKSFYRSKGAAAQMVGKTFSSD